MMRETSYQIGMGVWLGLPVLVFLLAAAAHVGWRFGGWLLQ